MCVEIIWNPTSCQNEKIEEPYRLILEKVYIQGKTLVTVASEMNYFQISNQKAIRKI